MYTLFCLQSVKNKPVLLINGLSNATMCVCVCITCQLTDVLNLFGNIYT